MATTVHNKVTPWEDYDYVAKTPDRFQYGGFAAGVFGYSLGIAANKTKNRLLALPLLCGAGIALGTLASWGMQEKARRRMLTIEDYMDRHPEDFVEPPPVKYKDLLVDWTPSR